MTLATIGAGGQPSLRMVLLKAVDPADHPDRGFVFYTNKQSRKGMELAGHRAVALLFHWKSLRRQVRIEGEAIPVEPTEADAYFATRPRLSRLGAWASDQSRPLADRATLERRLADMEVRFPDDAIPRPPHWGGWRLVPRLFRVLAGHAVPPARPGGLRAHGEGPVGDREALSVSTGSPESDVGEPPAAIAAEARYLPHYRMLMAGLGIDALEPDRPRTLVETAFLDFLLREFARLLPFDADFYASSYPDLAGARRRGELADLHAHFVANGYREGRLPYALPFDPDHYGSHVDLAGLRGDGGKAALVAHYQSAGRFEGRTGHPATEAAAERWVSAVRRSPYRLAQRSIDSAVVQAFNDPLAAPDGFKGGPVLGGSATDLRLRHRRGGVAVDSFPPNDEPVGLLSGEYVYGGAYLDHFGHTMAEMIHRVLPSRAAFDCRRLLFVGTRRHDGGDHGPAGKGLSGFEALPEVMQAALLFLGVEPADVTVMHDDRVVERLHIVQQGSELTFGPTAPYLEMLSAYTPPALAALDQDGEPSGGRLYVSRSRIPYGGILLGETYLEGLLHDEAWAILHPQEHSLVVQMQLYRRADTIMFAEGSAVHGTELFGAGDLGHCALLPRRHAHRGIFENILRPRARRFDTLPSATLIGSAVAHPDKPGATLEHMGVSVLDLPRLAHALRALDLAQLPRLDPPAYRRAARADLDRYIAWHRAAGTQLVPQEAIDALTAATEAALP